MFEMRCSCGRLLYKTMAFPAWLELDCHKCHGRVLTIDGRVDRVMTREEIKRLKKNK